MVVQHNLTAMNSNRMLGLTTASQAKSTEKLSSGYKINRAADDAAGLSISEKMRKQIRGLTQASTNAQDGISAVQTAEGALNEVQDMLQRMNELAVKSANGTNSETDRSYIQNEIDQLTTEIDRVSETTKFNETYLLKGDRSADKKWSFTYATQTAAAATPGQAATAAANGAGVTAVAIKAGKEDAVIDETYTYKNNRWEDAAGNDQTAFVNATFDLTGTAQANDTITTTAKVAGTPAVDAGTKSFYDADGNKISANALADYINVADDGTMTLKSGATTIYKDKDATTAVTDTDLTGGTNLTSARDLTGALTLKLHVGADATDNNQISVNIDAMSAKGLGVNGLKVDGADDTKAKDAIDTIKAAIQTVSTQRSALGAAQNRLEHTINNLDNVVENTTSAESQIRDTDMATEMVKYSNNNILAQAGQAMLAQANQSNQGVLSLLQ